MAIRCNTCRSEVPPGAASCPRCGAPVGGGADGRPIERLEDVAPGAILADRYEMIRELGAGGMGVVWLAHDRVRDEPVALKLLPRAVAHDPVAMVGIRREANLSLKLTHPNILRLLNLELAPFPFLLMEYVEGRSLQNVLAEKMEISEDGVGRLRPNEITPWLPGLADGLDHAHKTGVIHRDIKPANIMLIGALDAPIVKLTDFGIAAQLRDTATHLTQSGLAGTPVYMAPEQLKRKKVDKRVDIYALGVTIYQLLSGTLPFLSEYQIHNDPVPEIEGQTMLMHEVLCKALAREPADRYQSAGELAADFALVVEHGDKPIETADGAIEVRSSTPEPARSAPPPPVAPPVAAAPPPVAPPIAAAPPPVAAPVAHAAPAAPPPVFSSPPPPPALANFRHDEDVPSSSRAMANAGLAAMTGESSMARRLRAKSGALGIPSTPGPLYDEPEVPPPQPRYAPQAEPEAPPQPLSASQPEAEAPPPAPVAPPPAPQQPSFAVVPPSEPPPEPVASRLPGAPDDGPRTDPGLGSPSRPAIYRSSGPVARPIDPSTNPDAPQAMPSNPAFKDGIIPRRAPEPPPPPPPAPPSLDAKPVIPAGFTAAGTNEKGLALYRCDRDGSLMALVPAGKFIMGWDGGGEDEKPAHELTMRAFLIDIAPITNAMFERFVTEAGYQTEAERDGKGWAFDGKRFTTSVKGADWRHPCGPDDTIEGKAAVPVVQVSWNDADNYCKWARKSLPSEAQWERAARGGTRHMHPFGDVPPENRANFNNPGARGPTISGTFPPNEFGLQDMAGNVWEWCQDWYSATYFKETPSFDPPGPPTGGSKVLRGGNWHGSALQLRCSYRHRSDPVQRNSGTGFRCVVLLETA